MKMNLDKALKLLFKDDPLDVEQAFVFLAENRNEAVPRLIPLLKSRSDTARRQAGEALVRCEAREALPSVLDCFHENDEEIREMAVGLVGKLLAGEEESVPEIVRDALRSALLDENEYTVEIAVLDCLVRLGGEWALGVLFSNFRKGEDERYVTRQVARRVITMLRTATASEIETLLRSFPADRLAVAADALERLVSDDFTRSLAERFRELEKRQVDANALEGFGRILASPGGTGISERIVANDEVTREIEARLDGRGSRSLILVGPPGVGKTAALHAAFSHLAETRGATVLETSSGLILAGTCYLGQLETRLQQLVRLVSFPRNVVIYVTDVNHLIWAGRSSKSDENVASFLRPYVERGDIALVGESTPEQLAAGLGCTPEFRRLFKEIRTTEPSVEETSRIARHALTVDANRSGRNLGLPESVMRFSLDAADHFIGSSAFPGKALNLLEAALHRRIRETSERQVDLRQEDIVSELAVRTGLPRWLMDDRVPLDVQSVGAFFQERIIGQMEAVSAVVDLVTLVKAGLADPSKPLGVLLFIGPTGVGKTELARTVAEFLFGSKNRLVRLDMSEFSGPGSVQRLIGEPWDRQGNTDGILTGKIKESPFSVVLLDEFEKADPSVFDLMLQLFDSGRLSTSRGDVVSFRQTIIILTSNLGVNFQSASIGIVERSAAPSRGSVLRALESHFRPEFLNRIDKIVCFQALDPLSMRSIATRELYAVLSRQGITRRGIIMNMDESVGDFLMREGFSSKYGARPLKRTIESEILVPVAREIVKSHGGNAVLHIKACEKTITVRTIATEDTEEIAPHPAPLRERIASIKLLKRKISDLLLQFLDTRPRLNLDRLRKEKKSILERMQKGAFWTGEGSHLDIHRVQMMETIMEISARLEQDLEETGALVERLAKRHEPLELSNLSRGVEALSMRLSFLRLRASLNSDEDLMDAYVFLRRLDSQDTGQKPLPAMLEMYEGWASRCGCAMQVIHEAGAGEDSMDGAILQITGPHAFGLFKGESGFHRFAARSRRVRFSQRPQGKETELCQERSRISTFVRVSVIPEVPGGDLLLSQEVTLESRSLKASRGVRIKRKRSWAKATYLPTFASVEIENDLDLEPCRKAVLKLLAAVVASRNKAAPDESLTRIYYLSPEGEVRDIPSGLRSHRLDNILSGHLDSFVLGRQQRTSLLQDSPG
ncbi:MAG: AAA family ATPase [Armatimonadetes bacterium]|nr:AAA family ATPase [Armatimonadota bacterium]